MNRPKTVAILLVLVATTAAVAAPATTKPRSVGSTQVSRNTGTVAPPQVAGKITWKGNLALTPGADDACGHFQIKVFKPKDGAAAKGGIDVGAGGTDTGHIAAAPRGNIKTGACTYSLVRLPVGQPLYLSVTYDGKMGSAADTKLGTSAPFTVEWDKTATQDVQVAFTQIK